MRAVERTHGAGGAGLDCRGAAEAVIDDALARLAEANRAEVFLRVRGRDELVADMTASLAGGGPLAGRLLAVKNNVDVAGIATTAACPGFSYLPEQDAVAVARLRAAGAVVPGATNLDQFATGLVGARSPYGAVRAAHRPMVGFGCEPTAVTADADDLTAVGEWPIG